MVKKIDFEGIKVEYDDSELSKWSTQKQLTSYDTQFQALDRILCGKSDAIAEKLGDSMETMMQLIQRIVEISGNIAKN